MRKQVYFKICDIAMQCKMVFDLQPLILYFCLWTFSLILLLEISTSSVYFGCLTITAASCSWFSHNYNQTDFPLIHPVCIFRYPSHFLPWAATFTLCPAISTLAGQSLACSYRFVMVCCQILWISFLYTNVRAFFAVFLVCNWFWQRSLCVGSLSVFLATILK